MERRVEATLDAGGVPVVLASRADAPGFRFWLKTILDPEDVEVFSGWASRKSAEYRRLIRRFDRAVDDQQMESLLDVTLDLVNREKSEER